MMIDQFEHESKTIKDIIDVDYRSYAMYVLENRAIPSYIDGMKPVHRKLFYAMLTEHKGKKTKVADLGGISKYGYHHGEGSACSAAVTITADWNNNVPLFNGHGNFGSRLIQEAAAPRYIFASLNPDIEKIFIDYEVCDVHEDAEDHPEPKTYLPIIPWVLVNGIEGIAVGFACRYLAHLPSDIAKACILELNGKLKDDHVIPVTFPGFKGSVVQDTPNRVITKGVVTRTKRNTWEISEVPWGFDRESMINLLEKLTDDGKIDDYDENCDDSGFNFTIKMNSAMDAKCAKDPIAHLKLERAYSENYTALDEHGKLRLFESKIDIIRAFVKYRLGKVAEMIKYDLNAILVDIEWSLRKQAFITDVVTNKIKLQTKSRSEWVIDFATRYKTNQTDSNRLLAISMFECTQDSIDKLSAKLVELNAEKARLESLVPTEVYKRQLSSIR